MNGTTLTLGLVGALAAAGALSQRGSRSTIHDEIERLRKRIEKLRKMIDDGAVDDDEDVQQLISSLEEKLKRFESSNPEFTAARQREGRDFALRCAEKLVSLIQQEPGAPKQVNAWSREGVGVRVYLPGGQYLSVGQDGSVSEASRGRATLLWSGLYPAQRKAVRSALSKYLEWLSLTLESRST